MSSDELNEFLNMLSARTSLEEALQWDSELADYLIGAWATQPIDVALHKDINVALCVAQLPIEKYDIFSAPLEQWVRENYNILVR